MKLSGDLQDVLTAVNKEAEELDLFKKTWMKNDFNRKAGMSFKDPQQRDRAMAALAQRENAVRVMVTALKELDT